MKHKFLMIYCTVPDQTTAQKIAETLISERLAACCNIVPGLQSVYRWKGEICQDSELLLIIKSHADAYNRLEAKIKELHPYEVPEVVAIPIERGSPGYLKWVEENVN